MHPALLFGLLASSSLVQAAPAYKCKSFFVPVKVSNISLIELPFPEFKNSYQSVSFCNSAIERDAPVPAVKINPTPLTKTFDISVEYCTPTNKTSKANTLQLLSHGLGFDKSYWDFRLTPQETQYSWIDAALKAGYSTLSYDRLGCGKSPKADPYNVIQAQVELALLAELTGAVREGKIPGVPRPTHLVSVGHSWGSELVNALANVAPQLSDALVLTGYSHNLTYTSFFASASTFRLASENQPARFAGLSSGYITWSDKYANQFSFLEYPYFDPAVLEYAEAHKYPLTVGEFVSQGVFNFSAPSFTGPVLYYAAEKDLIFCGSNCTGSDFLGPTSSAVTAFGESKGVEVYIQPNTGHGLNLHYNATAGYNVVNSWLATNGF